MKTFFISLEIKKMDKQNKNYFSKRVFIKFIQMIAGQVSRMDKF